MRFFEDFIIGSAEDYGSVRVDEAEIRAFAAEFDPQPMHLDAASPQARAWGGLMASGWHTASMNMRLMADNVLADAAGMGSPGVSSLKWLAPVRPGDTLSGRMEVLDKRASASKPDRGFINFRFALRNQDGAEVLEQINLIMFGRREHGAENGKSGTLPPPAPEDFASEANAERLDFIEEIAPGTILRLGTYAFTPENIIHFARRFDPQPFHLSEEAGRASHFGGLSASGWHTASAWMRVMINYWRGLEAAGHRIPRRGPGFGFEDLHWKKPVIAGDTLTYFSRVIDARASASKPGWGVLRLRNYALNQRGIPVFAFTGISLWQARD